MNNSENAKKIIELIGEAIPFGIREKLTETEAIPFGTRKNNSEIIEEILSPLLPKLNLKDILDILEYISNDPFFKKYYKDYFFSNYDQIPYNVIRRLAKDNLPNLLSKNTQISDEDLDKLLWHFFEEIPDVALELLFEKLSFYNQEIPEAIEPALLFKDFAQKVSFFTELTPTVIYFAEFCIRNEKYRHAECALKYTYIYMRENEYFEHDYQNLLELLIYVSLNLGKYSQAIRYLEDYKDLYLKGEISLENYTEALIFVSKYIPQQEIKSISPDFNLIYEMYKENQKLKEENYEIKAKLSELTGPEKSLKSNFGILWENFDDITKNNLIKARKAEIHLKENNELFRDIIMGYFDAVSRELEKLIRNFNPYETLENKSPLQRCKELLRRKEFIDYLNKNTMGGKHIKQLFNDFIKPLSEFRNKLAHQNAQIPEISEINSFLSQKISGIIKFLMLIQPRPQNKSHLL